MNEREFEKEFLRQQKWDNARLPDRQVAHKRKPRKEKEPPPIRGNIYQVASELFAQHFASQGKIRDLQ
jgi:hypothetical protein